MNEKINNDFLRQNIENVVEHSKKAMDWSFSRSSGSGGQHVNKNDTKAHLSFDVEKSSFTDIDKSKIIKHYGDIKISLASETNKSQKQNKNDVLSKLDKILLEALRPKKIRRKTKVPFHEKKARLSAKKHNSEKKQRRKINRADYL